MGVAASKTQGPDDRRIVARIKADMHTSHHGASGPTARHTTRHSHRSPSSRRQLQHSASAPAGVPGQAQFGYLIQQVGEDPNQVQVTPGYYYAGYEQSKDRQHRHRSSRRHNSAPSAHSSHRSRHQRSHRHGHDSKTTQRRTSSRERGHGSRRSGNNEPRSQAKSKEHDAAPPNRSRSERRSIPEVASEFAANPDGSDGANMDPHNSVPERQRAESNPRNPGPTSSQPQPPPLSQPAKDTESYHKKRHDNPLPKPPRDVYDSSKYRDLKRSQTVDSSAMPPGPSIMRESKPGRSHSERAPQPRSSRHHSHHAHHHSQPAVLNQKSTSFDSRIDKKLPRPPIKDRVLDKLFSIDFGGGGGGGGNGNGSRGAGPSGARPSSSQSNRRGGPLSALRSFTLPAFPSIPSMPSMPNIPLKKSILNRTQSQLVNRDSGRGEGRDTLPPYVRGPPISIPLNSPLNPASPYDVTYRKKSYPTAAHLFEAQKFLKHKPELAERLRMVTESPSEMGKLSYSFQTEGLVRDDWELVWRDKLDEVMWLKFAQHPQLREELLSTGYALLLDGNEVRHADPDTPGVNELGKAYMRLRDRLRLEEQSRR